MHYKNNLFPFSCVSDRFRVVLSHDVCFSKNQKEIISCGRVVSSNSVSADNYVFSPSSELVQDVGILPAYSIVHITESMLPARLLQAQPSARRKKERTMGGEPREVVVPNPQIPVYRMITTRPHNELYKPKIEQLNLRSCSGVIRL